MTETTNLTVKKLQGTLFYDDTCHFCRRGIQQIRKPLARIAVEVQPFANGSDEKEMILRWHDGRVLGGADAAIFLARRIPWCWLPATFAGLFPFRHLTRAIYRVIARNRHCLGRAACKIVYDPPVAKPGWTITAFLVSTAVMIGIIFHLDNAPWMWLIAISMWLGLKTMCFQKSGGFAEIDPAYFFWPGMRTTGFSYDRKNSRRRISLLPSLGFVSTGLLLLLAIPFLPPPMLAGWAGVMAMICLLHFGSFVWIDVLWTRLGYCPEPIMRQPWKSTGLGDFWGSRWNRAFSDWARDFIFHPLNRKLGLKAGTMFGFLISGFAHELVISVPARGGYGLPTLYFLLQGIGLLLEKQLQLRRRGLARIWLRLFIIIPAPLLFHRTFFENVFNPMTKLITNLWTY